jgi:ligand-binding sensor domain-containing protein
VDAGGTLWLSSREPKGYVVLIPSGAPIENQTIFTPKGLVAGVGATSFSPDQEGGMWMVLGPPWRSENGVHYVPPASTLDGQRTIQTPAWPGNSPFSAAMLDSRRHLWIGRRNENGLFRVSLDEVWKPDFAMEQIHEVSQFGATLFGHSDGSIWFSASPYPWLDDRITRLHGGQVTTFRPKDPSTDFPGRAALCFGEDAAGLLYIGTPNGLVTFNGKTFNVVAANPDEPRPFSPVAIPPVLPACDPARQGRTPSRKARPALE